MFDGTCLVLQELFALDRVVESDSEVFERDCNALGGVESWRRQFGASCGAMIAW